MDTILYFGVLAWETGKSIIFCADDVTLDFSYIPMCEWYCNAIHQYNDPLFAQNKIASFEQEK